MKSQKHIFAFTNKTYAFHHSDLREIGLTFKKELTDLNLQPNSLENSAFGANVRVVSNFQNCTYHSSNYLSLLSNQLYNCLELESNIKSSGCNIFFDVSEQIDFKVGSERFNSAVVKNNLTSDPPSIFSIEENSKSFEVEAFSFM